MNRIGRTIVYSAAILFIIGLVTWRFGVLEDEKNAKKASFPSIYSEQGNPVELKEIKFTNLKLYRKASGVLRANNALVAKVGRLERSFLKTGQEIYEASSDNIIGKISNISNRVSLDDGLFIVNIKLTKELSKEKLESKLYPIRIHYETAENILVLPINSLMPMNQKLYVWVSQGESAAMQEVKIGKYNQKFLEIKSGLNAGDKVLVNGHRTLINTDKLRVVTK